jgi:hypothetical protein
MATGVAEQMARDTVYLARRFQVHQVYFVTTGWSEFDLYGGKGDTFQERTNDKDIPIPPSVFRVGLGRSICNSFLIITTPRIKKNGDK